MKQSASVASSTPFSLNAESIGLPQEFEELNAADATILVPVNPDEGRVRLEIFDFSEALPLSLDAFLSSADGEEEFLELELELMAECPRSGLRHL